jgi:hypothetical protein
LGIRYVDCIKNWRSIIKYWCTTSSNGHGSYSGWWNRRKDC